MSPEYQAKLIKAERAAAGISAVSNDDHDHENDESNEGNEGNEGIGNEDKNDEDDGDGHDLVNDNVNNNDKVDNGNDDVDNIKNNNDGDEKQKHDHDHHHNHQPKNKHKHKTNHQQKTKSNPKTKSKQLRQHKNKLNQNQNHNHDNKMNTGTKHENDIENSFIGEAVAEIINTVQNQFKSINQVWNGYSWSEVKFDSTHEYVHEFSHVHEYGDTSGSTGTGTSTGTSTSTEDDEVHSYNQPPPAIFEKDQGEEEHINIGDIFVSIPSYRDEKRCGLTLYSLYTNAHNPNKVYVGLVEQVHTPSATANESTTKSCIDYYCLLYDISRKSNEENEENISTSTSGGTSKATKKSSTSSTSLTSCPYQNQISTIQISTWSSKGPAYARSIAQRKLLSNQQFCMSINSYSKMIQNWDDVAIEEWKVINNEFAVLSNRPSVWETAAVREKKMKDAKERDTRRKRHRHKKGGKPKPEEEEIIIETKEESKDESKDESKEKSLNLDDLKMTREEKENEKKILRPCMVFFNNYDIPYYEDRKDDKRFKKKSKMGGRIISDKVQRLSRRRALTETKAKQTRAKKTRKHHKEDKGEKSNNPDGLGQNGLVKDLSKPLLSYSWSSEFSFSKCHLDTNVPSDNFMTQFIDTEGFSRYARMFTRGYDVYTPTQNIIYQDYGEESGKGQNFAKTGWTHDEMESVASIERVHSILGIHKLQNKDEKRLGNLGIYGLGRLRSLKQLENFVGINLEKAQGHDRRFLPTCAKLKWEAYREEIGKGALISNPQRLSTISPMDNLYIDTDTIYADPQPEFTNRIVTKATMSSYYDKRSSSPQKRNLDVSPWLILSVLMLFLFMMKKFTDEDCSDYDNDEICIDSMHSSRWSFKKKKRIGKRTKTNTKKTK